jgi:ubiquitin C-terminal hydrolase
MDAIADEIKSLEVKEKADVYRGLRDEAVETITVNTGSANRDEVVNLNLPPGLDNLRNTCYLNSILQYFFTVNAVRDIVLNFDADTVTPAAQPDKTGEIYLGRECESLLTSTYLEKQVC